MEAAALQPSNKEKYLCADHGDGFNEFDDVKSKRKNWTTLSDARLSAAKGCLVCSMFCKVLACYDEKISSYSASELDLWWKSRVEIGDIGDFSVSYQNRGIINCILTIDVYAHKSSPLPNDSPFSCLNASPREHICSDPFSDASISVIQQWMDTCLSTHGDCCGLTQNAEPHLPTRVLDLGLSSDSSIHLLESHGFQGTYVALSHCWGDQTVTPLLKITDSTIEAHRRNIPWEALSNTFRDAIRLTRKLGIRYLLIDSLCILQGDTTEWLVESAKMESVYGNAYLVLAATDGSSCEHGFPKRPTHHELSLADQKGNSHKLSVRESVHRSHSNLTLGIFSQAYPLIRRAWAFQECLLACRVLHLCSKEFIWECGAGTWCECTLGEWEPTVKSITKRLTLGANSHQQLLGLWSEVIKYYTSADLTYQPDKLVAISSLAKRFQVDILGRYIAGLWERHLIHGLCWYNDYSMLQSIGKQSTKLLSGGPSWSWASGGYCVLHPPVQRASSYIERAEIHAVNIELESLKAPLGGVKRGEISLTGHIFPVLFERIRLGIFPKGCLRTEGNEALDFLFDSYCYEPLFETRDVNELAYILWLQSSSSPYKLSESDEYEAFHTSSKNRNFQQVLLGKRAGHDIEESDPSNLERALVLKKVKHGMGYQRIGILAAEGESAITLRRLFGLVEKQYIVLI